MILTGAGLTAVVNQSLDPAPKIDQISVDLHLSNDLAIPSHTFATCPAVEEFDMSKQHTAHLTGRSSHMRRGIFMPGGYVDPGFTGELMLEFFNMSDDTQKISNGEAVARLVFYELMFPVNDGYNGKWSE